MTGNNPLSGTETGFSMTVTNNAELTWLWTTNILPGTIAGSPISIVSTNNAQLAYFYNGTNWVYPSFHNNYLRLDGTNAFSSKSPYTLTNISQTMPDSWTIVDVFQTVGANVLVTQRVSYVQGERVF